MPLQGALFLAFCTQGDALGYVLMPLRGASTHLTEEPNYRQCQSFALPSELWHHNKKGVTLLRVTPYKVWYHQESNRGHKDFQSFALPTELWHHAFLFSECKGRCFYLIAQIFRWFFLKRGIFLCFRSVKHMLVDIFFKKTCVGFKKSVYLCTCFWGHIPLTAIGM